MFQTNNTWVNTYQDYVEDYLLGEWLPGLQQWITDQIGAVADRTLTEYVIAGGTTNITPERIMQAVNYYLAAVLDAVGNPQPIMDKVNEVITAVADALGLPPGMDPNDPEGNTGDADVPDAEQLLSAAPSIADDPAVLADKTAAVAHIAAVFAARDAADATGTDPSTVCLVATLVGPCKDTEIPEQRKISNALARLHKQETNYTCAPASVRSILHAMTGTDFTEDALRVEMNEITLAAPLRYETARDVADAVGSGIVLGLGPDHAGSAIGQLRAMSPAAARRAVQGQAPKDRLILLARGDRASLERLARLRVS